MSQSNNDEKIIARWPYLAFRAMYELVKRPSYVNKKDNSTFTKLAFKRKDGSYCFVSWSSKLNGELTNEEIKANPDKLQIVQLEVDEETKKKRKEQGLQEESYVICRMNDILENAEATDL